MVIFETKLKTGAINCNIQLEGFKLLHSDSNTSAAGVALYIKVTHTFRLNDCSQQKLPYAEHLWVDIQTERGSIAVGMIYRHSDDSGPGIEKFNEEISDFFFTLNNNKRSLYCVGDFKINLLKLSDKTVIRRYAIMRLSCY